MGLEHTLYWVEFEGDGGTTCYKALSNAFEESFYYEIHSIDFGPVTIFRVGGSCEIAGEIKNRFLTVKDAKAACQKAEEEWIEEEKEIRRITALSDEECNAELLACGLDPNSGVERLNEILARTEGPLREKLNAQKTIEKTD